MTLKEAERQLAGVYTDYVRHLRSSLTKMASVLPPEMGCLLEVVEQLGRALARANSQLLDIAEAQ